MNRAPCRVSDSPYWDYDNYVEERSVYAPDHPSECDYAPDETIKTHQDISCPNTRDASYQPTTLKELSYANDQTVCVNGRT